MRRARFYWREWYGRDYGKVWILEKGPSIVAVHFQLSYLFGEEVGFTGYDASGLSHSLSKEAEPDGT
jgi:hypothetical protein